MTDSRIVFSVVMIFMGLGLVSFGLVRICDNKVREKTDLFFLTICGTMLGSLTGIAGYLSFLDLVDLRVSVGIIMVIASLFNIVLKKQLNNPNLYKHSKSHLVFSIIYTLVMFWVCNMTSQAGN